ncbi:DUF4013 domain-containing protein [Halobaculum lipolyticum]|uniref:DUF4013 domain-containing protein n=1 Tax=Halobaculum lipolyticum TaxID=3032001 RepID=A0ABD5WLH5_9EURY|nr:DUF4013 domain-containing protein [Halobaculum sp. DT31]
MIEQALRFPFGTADDRGATAEALLVGGGLHVLAAFVPVVPLIPVMGYLVRVLGAAGEADDPADLPTFRSPASLVRDGLVGGVLALGFCLVPVVLLVVTVGGALSGGAAGGPIDPTTPLGYGVTLIGGTITLLLAVAVVYPLPAVIAGYARADPEAGTLTRVRTAFSRRRLRASVTSGRYFYAWTVGVVLLLFGAALASAGTRFTRLVGFFGLFYLEVAAAAAWSRGVGGND